MTLFLDARMREASLPPSHGIEAEGWQHVLAQSIDKLPNLPLKITGGTFATFMSTEDNKAVVRRAIEEVWNQGNVALADELYAPNVIYQNPGVADIRTLENFKRFVTAFRSAFPDGHSTIEDVIAEGDEVVLRHTFRSTNTGDFVTPMPLSATGKQVTMTGIAIAHPAGGKVVEVLDMADNLGLLQQLGVIPAPEQAS
jgi:predicted ester cyclase